MKCRKCDARAVINMRQHKLALCKEHFLEWILDQTQRFITEYRMFSHQDRILVAVSGGKDSLSLWDVLQRLGYNADGLYIGLGIDGGIRYSSESQRLCEQFAEQHNLHLSTIDIVKTEGASVPEVAQHTLRGKGRPCSVCGLTKRYIMNRFTGDGNYDVLVTGHNLDDEAAVLFGNTLNWAGEYLARQSPVLEASPAGFIRKAKPFFRFYERETAAYAFLRGIEYIHEECPYAVGAKSIYYKEVLNQLEQKRPGLKLSFYLSFLRAKGEGFFTKPETWSAALNVCESCGQPTSAPQKCAFCRTWDQARSHMILEP